MTNRRLKQTISVIGVVAPLIGTIFAIWLLWQRLVNWNDIAIMGGMYVFTALGLPWIALVAVRPLGLHHSGVGTVGVGMERVACSGRELQGPLDHVRRAARRTAGHADAVGVRIRERD